MTSQWLRRVGNRIPRRLRRVLGMVVPHATTQEGQWCRKVMNNHIASHLSTLEPSQCHAVEISGNRLQRLPWRSYKSLTFPDFDLCHATHQDAHDVVICEQVLEHVVDPCRAAATLFELCKPGAHVIVSTPFLIKIHQEPEDYWRFTPLGLQTLLENVGFEGVEVIGWGNRSCVRANFRRWLAYKPWHSLRNEMAYPVAVWAYGRRPA